MKFEPKLESARLIKRYKRFLADIELANGTQITIHCPNTGAMTGCAEPGWRVHYSDSNNPKRKYRHTWEWVENGQGDAIVVNTGRANYLAEEALTNKLIPQLAGYNSIKREVKYGQENSRIDLLLQNSDLCDCYVEVKNVTLLAEDGQGYFPDAVTTRGQKHLRELMSMVAQGSRACILFVVAHSGITKVTPAEHIDPKYAQLCRDAVAGGVEFYAVSAHAHSEGISLIEPIDVMI
ncbi:DNA/RNA nuclease SfsA [Ferrimonas lipolytica]|uniref:Sugar fermentation stimulation protein homolog n=1 Tax=Ferrimonas lipolytica TaxID=2724191 RepID=A0A6H1UGF3_9GAMM|nr:DNA/RNA nuclease SfsA [Ferrimonas lipolytica]